MFVALSGGKRFSALRSITTRAMTIATGIMVNPDTTKKISISVIPSPAIALRYAVIHTNGIGHRDSVSLPRKHPRDHTTRSIRRPTRSLAIRLFQTPPLPIRPPSV